MPNTKKPKVKKPGEKGSGLTAENSPKPSPTLRMTRALSAGSGIAASSEQGNVISTINADFQSAKGSQSQPATLVAPPAAEPGSQPVSNAMDTTMPVHGMDPAKLPLAQTVTVSTTQSNTATPGTGDGSASTTPKSKAKKKKDENDVSFTL